MLKSVHGNIITRGAELKADLATREVRRGAGTEVFLTKDEKRS